MASVISAGTTSGTALNLSSDTSGVLQLASNSGTTALTITTAQNVGIGTTSPAVKLDVQGTVGTSTALLKLANTSAPSASNIVQQQYFASNSFGGNEQIASITALNPNASANNGGALVFSTSANGTATTPTEAMRITSAGNVGIGLTSLSNKLQVADNIAVQTTGTLANLNFLNSSGTGIQQIQYNDTTGGLTIGGGFAGSYPVIFRYSTATETMRIDTSGNLLVGTTSVTGNTQGFTTAVNAGTTYVNIGHITGSSSGASYAIFNYNGTGIGSISQSGTTAVLYNTTSDQRLKENIVDAPSGNIDSIKVRSFDWITDGTHQTYGMVAQELAEVAPYAVHQPQDPEEMMAVDYSKLVPMMIKEIQDLKQRIATLESK